ncbi:hypothetical protein O181_059702 [Austropuccinia psidii MF-1]|uniref:Uncharacterized protein n=1 Tax=Austropuccinia psidii MF-1 TaxID=1389203 RepID=A0A9Q3HXP1_9BASI|nr:hypothetical protein [Austropuccinia psidii MF-1]
MFGLRNIFRAPEKAKGVKDLGAAEKAGHGGESHTWADPTLSDPIEGGPSSKAPWGNTRGGGNTISSNDLSASRWRRLKIWKTSTTSQASTRNLGELKPTQAAEKKKNLILRFLLRLFTQKPAPAARSFDKLNIRTAQDFEGFFRMAQSPIEKQKVLEQSLEMNKALKENSHELSKFLKKYRSIFLATDDPINLNLEFVAQKGLIDLAYAFPEDNNYKAMVLNIRSFQTSLLERLKDKAEIIRQRTEEFNEIRKIPWAEDFLMPRGDLDLSTKEKAVALEKLFKQDEGINLIYENVKKYSLAKEHSLLKQQVEELAQMMNGHNLQTSAMQKTAATNCLAYFHHALDNPNTEIQLDAKYYRYIHERVRAAILVLDLLPFNEERLSLVLDEQERLRNLRVGSSTAR